MAFIVFEGIDGCGKTTLMSGVAARLREEGGDPVCLREPGSTALGERVRGILLDADLGDLSPWTEACLFVACRAEMVATCIRPALKAGRSVLLDRYVYSTIAYQGAGAGADIGLLQGLNAAATGRLLPDLVLLSDLDPREAARRRSQDDRMEAKGLAFQERVRTGYLVQARADPERWRVLDGRLPAAALLDEAWRIIRALEGCGRRGGRGGSGA